MYKLNNSLIPVAVGNHFELRNAVPTYNYNLRNRGTMHRVDTRLESSEKSIQIRGEKLWEVLPENLRSSTSLKRFKRTLKSKLIDAYAE